MKTFGWTCTITPFTSPATSEQTYNSCCLDKWQNYVISASSKLTTSCPKTLALLSNSTCMKTWVWTSRLPSLTGRKTRREGQDVRFWRWLSIKRSKHWFSFTSRKSGTIRIHFTRQSSQPGTSTLQFRQGETRGKRCYQKVVEQQQFPPNEIHNLQTTHSFLDLGFPPVFTNSIRNHVENLLNTQIPVPPPQWLGPKGWTSEFLLRAPRWLLGKMSWKTTALLFFLPNVETTGNLQVCK